MTDAEWNDLHTGDVLVNNVSRVAYTVQDSQVYEEGEGSKTVIVLTRSFMAHTPDEWTRKRKTVDM